MKDITKKYVQDWMSHTRKLRVDEEWWQDTMKAFSPPANARTKKEDKVIQANLMQQPLPKVIGDFKNHPL